MSIAGGYYKAVEAAAKLEMDCVQLFTKNNNQWAAKPITSSDVENFKTCLKQADISHPVAHDSYLINLASPDDVLWTKSRDAFAHELERAEALGLMGVVMHPGAHVASTPEEGLGRIVTALDAVHESTSGFQTLTLLETTAGQGTTLGAKFEELAWIIERVQAPDRVGVCVDTCHIFSAGYPLIAAAEFKATFAEFDRLIGISRIKAFHLNDSLKAFGSRVDRHAHIGRGTLGLEPFRHLLNDKRFAKIPMYLETEKGEEDGEELDAINLRTLRDLIKSRAS
jgi:deoxyribonuclease-4